MAAAVCVTATVLFALVPAVLATGIDLAGALRSESGAVVGAGGRAWIRSTLVLVQVSLSFVLLVGAVLLVRSVQNARHASPGFSTDGVLTTTVDLFTAGYDGQRARTFQDELIDRLEALGGVESAAFSRLTPFTYRSYSSASIAVDGYEAPPDQQPTAEYNEIGRSASRSCRAANSRAPTTNAGRSWRSSMKRWPLDSGAGPIRSGVACR